MMCPCHGAFELLAAAGVRPRRRLEDKLGAERLAALLLRVAFASECFPALSVDEKALNLEAALTAVSRVRCCRAAKEREGE